MENKTEKRKSGRQEYMLIFFGTKTIKKKVRNGLRRQIYCSRCRCMQELQEFRRVRYFTLYFVPIFPIKKGESVLTCPVCDESYVVLPEHYYNGTTGNYSSSPAGETIPAKVIINCMHCEKKMRIPNVEKPIMVTCPHCREKFEVSRVK
jgi:hypothetical protein